MSQLFEELWGVARLEWPASEPARKSSAETAAPNQSDWVEHNVRLNCMQER